MINYIRKVKGKVVEKGQCNAWEDIAHLRKAHPRQYSKDDGTTQLSPPSAPVLPQSAVDPNVVTVEELTDAVIKLAAGDPSAVDTIALRRKRAIKKAEKNGADQGGSAKRSARRNKATSQ